MNHHYDDIRSKLGEPQWWDEHAVPRYCDFSPDEVANIYAEQVALAEIACQGCERLFKVAFSYDTMDMILWKARSLDERIKAHELHYGDPPNVGCCAAGATMNSVPLRVLEFWHRDLGARRRDPELEIDITPDWAAS